MKRNITKILAAVIITAAVLALWAAPAFAQSKENVTIVPDEKETQEILLHDNKTLTPDGNANLIDNVTDNKNLQFITVTAKDGNIFYIIIDKASTNQNVYFLNTVDESDLTALVDDYETPAEPEPTEPDTSEDTEEQADDETEKESGNGGMLYILIILAAAGGLFGYYYKVILPKKKLEQADDLEDFEFEETEPESDMQNGEYDNSTEEDFYGTEDKQ